MTTHTTTAKIVNGVDTEALMQTLSVLRDQPDKAQFQFRADNRWLGGTRNRSTIQGFYGAGAEDETRTKPYIMDCDEPAVLLGGDTGANPVEYLLNAVAGCMTTTMAMHAASRGVTIESLESHVEGEIDVRGFTGLSATVPKGYKEIHVNFRAKTDGDAAMLEELAKMSPVYNTVAGRTPIIVKVEII